MPFSEAEMERIREALNKAVPRWNVCQFCGSQSWIMSDEFTLLPIGKRRAPGGSFDWSRTAVSISLVCAQCGNTLLFNAKVLGLGDLIE
jgi:hypothetical protein